MKYILILIAMLYANAYAGNYGYYDTKVRPNSCMFGNICHKNEYRTLRVYYDRVKIKFVSYEYQGNNIIATFLDYNHNQYYKQLTCPSVINKIGKTYDVLYDPHKDEYMIYCSNFK